MNLVQLNCILEMIKINFMLYVFYHSKKNGKTKIKELNQTSLWKPCKQEENSVNDFKHSIERGKKMPPN